MHYLINVFWKRRQLFPTLSDDKPISTNNSWKPCTKIWLIAFQISNCLQYIGNSFFMHFLSAQKTQSHDLSYFLFVSDGNKSPHRIQDAYCFRKLSQTYCITFSFKACSGHSKTNTKNISHVEQEIWTRCEYILLIHWDTIYKKTLSLNISYYNGSASTNYFCWLFTKITVVPIAS
jgi:hypothetical protein